MDNGENVYESVAVTVKHASAAIVTICMFSAMPIASRSPIHNQPAFMHSYDYIT